MTPIGLYFKKNLSYILGKLNKIWVVKTIWGLSRFRMQNIFQIEEVQKVILTDHPTIISQFNLKDIQALLEALSLYYHEDNYDPSFTE